MLQIPQQYLTINAAMHQITPMTNNKLGIIRKNHPNTDNSLFSSCMRVRRSSYVLCNSSVVKLLVTFSLSTKLEGEEYDIE